jgi:dTDP-4-dehydrorhamnose reductase
VPRLLLTGASGYVGGRVVEQAPADWDVHAQWRSRQPPPGATPHRLDLADGAGFADLVRRTRPDVVLHAAYDMAAGGEPNLLWSGNVFAAARGAGVPLVFVSTDLVFDGRRGWYREDEPPNPTLEYGRWKADMERRALEQGGVVVRTSLVWGLDPVADSVEKLVLEPLRSGQTPRLFEDEWRTPTEVHDLAAALLEACGVRGPCVLHFASPERISRLDLGRLIARHHGFDPGLLPPFRRAEVAPNRPADTSLAVTALTRDRVDARFRGPSEILGGR